MPLQRKTLRELQEFYEATMAAKFGITSPLLKNSVVKVLSFVFASGDHILYGLINFLSRQIFPDTADTDRLDQWAAIWGITRKDASFAAGDCVFTGVDTTVIPTGTIIVRADNVEFETDSDGTIGSITPGEITVPVTAVVAGVDANTEAGSILTLSTPIPSVDANVTVDVDGLTDGADIESDEDLRTRLLTRIQNPPQGGSESDYEQWTLSVSGVTRAFVFPNYLGAGNVGVSFVLDDDPVDIIPGPSKIQEVEDYIEPRRSVTHNVTVFAPTPVDLDIEVNVSPNTAAVRAAITAELEDLLRREGAPGATILLSQINEAISIAEGEDDHELIDPVTNVFHDPTEIPVLGAVVFDDL